MLETHRGEPFRKSIQERVKLSSGESVKILLGKRRIGDNERGWVKINKFWWRWLYSCEDPAVEHDKWYVRFSNLLRNYAAHLFTESQ